MIKESNAMTFTNRLNYSVSDVPVEEFLSILSQYGQEEKNRKQVESIQTRFHQIK